MKLFLTILIIVFGLSQTVYSENSFKKLKFKESGPFYGIKKNGLMYRGIYKSPKNETAQTDYYGLFTKNEMFWKGYSKHTYEDGRILYQYNEYKLDSEGRVIKDKDGVFQILESYLISADDFEKVKKYISLDIDLPFSFYDFDIKEEQIVDNKLDTKKQNLISNNEYEDISSIKSFIKVNETFEKNLGNIDNNIKNLFVSINKSNEEIKTEFFFIKDNENLKFTILESVQNPNYKTISFNGKEFTAKKYLNIPEENENYLKFGKNKNIVSYFNLVASWSIIYSLDNKYLEFKDFNSPDINEPLIIFSKNKFSGLCKKTNEYYRELWKLSCEELFDYLVSEVLNKDLKYFDDLPNLEQSLIASLKNDKQINIKSNENYYALIIGNNNYEFLEKLDAAENDAIVIANVLEKKYGFEVDLLLNADYDTTVNSLFKITNKLKSNDNLLIYYAGHGELDKAENRGYWLPVDASYEMRSKWISNQRIVDRIKATKAKHVLLVADSCFSGTLMRSGTNLQNQEQIDEKYIERLKNKKTRLVITSGGNEPVVDSVGGDHSLFALKFIDTLKNNNSVINSQILFENVRRYVVANADQTPERAMVHKTGHDGGDFLFFPK